MKRLKDYTSTREIIENPKVYCKSETKQFSEEGRFIHIPRNIKNKLRISKYNQHEFRVIIVKKDRMEDANT